MRRALLRLRAWGSAGGNAAVVPAVKKPESKAGLAQLLFRGGSLPETRAAVKVVTGGRDFAARL